MIRPVRVFLDSNVLFSAAYKSPNDFEKLWSIPSVDILCSRYVLEEVMRNLPSAEGRGRLWKLVYLSHLVPDDEARVLPDHVRLPDKDRPILQSAIAGGADILVTGDWEHFGRYLETRIEGVLLESPRMFKRRYPHLFREHNGA